jgi:DNA-binding CsgD family transcriptional regulator
VVTSRPSPVGRGELLARARASLAAGGSVLFHGPAGIGKSTLLDTVAAEPGAALVLRAAAAEAEAELPYLALVDLFGMVLDDPLAAAPTVLPAHLRAALDGALLRSALPATPHDQLAVRLAVLELLRGLAVRRPVLLVIDDVQWLDEPSLGVLRFVARRLEGVAARVLAAERVTDGASPQRLYLCPAPATELAVPPLPEPDLADLLHARFGAAVPRGRLHRLYEASGGNPLFAVELGRALEERGESLSPTEPLPVPDRLRGLLAARIANLPAEGRWALLVAAATARPSRGLLARCGVGVSDSGVDPLDDAVRAGVVVLDADGAVRFTHPLLREMVYADAEPAARRSAHELLGTAVTDPVERARHFAHARPDPDEELAETLAEAASVARLRGAPATAADLAELAADRTPAATPGVAAMRRLTAAQYAYAAGSPTDAHRHATAALRDAADRRTRVGARLLLVDLSGQDWSGVTPLLDAAYCDAADSPDLLAKVRLYRSYKAFYDADMEATFAELKLAEEAAEQSGETERLVEVVNWRGMVMDGREGDEFLERAGELARGLPLTTTVVSARQMSAMARLFRGDVAEAVHRIEALRTAVERSGTVRDLAGVLISVSGVYLRAGRCADARVAARACARLFGDVETTPGPGLVVAGITEATCGSVERAAGYAEQAVVACVAAGDEDWLKGAYIARGLVHLLRGDPAGAADQMRRAFAMEQRLGRVDPGVLLWHGDYIEALVGAGARAEAAEVLTEVSSAAEHLGRHTTLLSLARAEALLRAATGEPRDGIEALTKALAEWADHPYPVEIARAWHVLGGLERRAHRRGAARAALAEALRRYTEAEALPWRDAAAADLARLDGGRGAGLSETERRIVELVRAGATNREIARSLFLSIKAVEANLTRLYRRLGVRNRAQLARALDGVEANG